MLELGIAYQLIGPDGTRAVLGNCDAAALDPDFVGYLDPENGITGLLDGPDIEDQGGSLVERDGGRTGSIYEGRRPGTVSGIYLPNGSMAQINAADAKLKRATRALRADGKMRWTPTGESIERELRFRRQTAVRGGGRRPKTFNVGLVCADARVLASNESQLSFTPDQAVGIVGFTSPMTSPLKTASAVTGAGVVVNSGTVETWPRFRIDGPITQPVIINNTTGQQIAFLGQLLAGEYLLIDAKIASVLLNGAADRYGLYNFGASDWWQLQPGSNDIRIGAAAYGAGALLTVYWRHAWE